MNEFVKWYSNLIRLSIFCSIISSLSLLAAVLVNSESKNQMILISFGLVFWVGLILEQALFWKANSLKKELFKLEKRTPRGRIGILSIAASSEGFVADVVFAGSLIALVVCMMFHLGEALVQYIFICLMVLSFRMHCILNGKNYRYKKYIERKVDRKNG